VGAGLLVRSRTVLACCPRGCGDAYTCGLRGARHRAASSDIGIAVTIQSATARVPHFAQQKAISMTSKRPWSPSGPAIQLALTILILRVCSLAPGMRPRQAVCVGPQQLIRAWAYVQSR